MTSGVVVWADDERVRLCDGWYRDVFSFLWQRTAGTGAGERSPRGMPVMGHDYQIGQASGQATEVGRTGVGLPPQRTAPKQGTLTEPIASRVMPRQQTSAKPASKPQASHHEESQALHRRCQHSQASKPYRARCGHATDYGRQEFTEVLSCRSDRNEAQVTFEGPILTAPTDRHRSD